MNGPKIIKISPQKTPREEQKKVTFVMMGKSRLELSVACSSAIAGSSMEAMELVSAEGKRMHGKAIPVKTPYIAKA